MNLEIDKKFNNSVKRISEMEKDLPPDVLLRLYAYYKQAVKGDTFVFDVNNSEPDLKNAFKFNAWIQLKGMSGEDAKKEYINLSNEILK